MTVWSCNVSVHDRMKGELKPSCICDVGRGSQLLRFWDACAMNWSSSEVSGLKISFIFFCWGIEIAWNQPKMSIRRNTSIGHILDEVFLRCLLCECLSLCENHFPSGRQRLHLDPISCKLGGEPKRRVFQNSHNIEEITYNYYFFIDVIRNKRIFWWLQKNFWD